MSEDTDKKAVSEAFLLLFVEVFSVVVVATSSPFVVEEVAVASRDDFAAMVSALTSFLTCLTSFATFSVERIKSCGEVIC